MKSGTTSTHEAWPAIPRDGAGKLVEVVSVSVPSHGILRLLWTDGITRDVDVAGSLDGRHPLLRQLADPAVFSTARVGGFGGVEWANGIDMCPHALRLQADEQDAVGIAAAE